MKKNIERILEFGEEKLRETCEVELSKVRGKYVAYQEGIISFTEIKEALHNIRTIYAFMSGHYGIDLGKEHEEELKSMETELITGGQN